MKILFPNPYGYKLPSNDLIASMQRKYKFSDGYADFLRVQNGFLISKLEEDSNNGNYLSYSPEESSGKQDFRVLYGLDSNDKYYDLVGNLQSFIFENLFFPIGVDYGGNDFVEILHGRYKGYIAILDHELHASCDSLQEFVEEFELENFNELSLTERTDLLVDVDVDNELGLTWVLAPSMNDFVENCIHCDDYFSGYVIDLVSS